MNIRFVKNAVGGPGVDYRAGHVYAVSTAAGNEYIQGKQAIAEGPDPSGSIHTLFVDAGYIPLSPAPSGYIGPSGWIRDIPEGQFGFYQSNDYQITVVFPGEQETTFDVLHMEVPKW